MQRCWKYVLYSSPPSQSQRQIKWHWNQIQIQWCITWKQAHGTYSTRPHDENPQELFYIIKLTQIHDAESAWRYSKEYRSCRQIAFIHGDVHDDGWMREYSITLKNDVEKILFQCRSIMLYSAHTTVRYWQYKYKYTWRTTQQEEQQNKSNEIAIL